MVRAYSFFISRQLSSIVSTVADGSTVPCEVVVRSLDSYGTIHPKQMPKGH